MATKKIHYSTVRKELENWLEIYSVEQVQKDCKKNLQRFRENPDANKWQINYYSKFWELLSEYE